MQNSIEDCDHDQINIFGTLLQKSLEKTLAPLTSMVTSLKQKPDDDGQVEQEGQNEDAHFGRDSHQDDEIENIDDGETDG